MYYTTWCGGVRDREGEQVGQIARGWCSVGVSVDRAQMQYTDVYVALYAYIWRKGSYVTCLLKTCYSTAVKEKIVQNLTIA